MPREEKDLKPALFEQNQLRRVWHKGEWYYSITDVIAILTDSTNPRVYWANLKVRAKSEGLDEALVQIEALKLKSLDGRFRLTDTANRQTLLRIIQSIPSPKADLSVSGWPRSEKSVLRKSKIQRLRWIGCEPHTERKDMMTPGLKNALKTTLCGTN